VKVRLRLRLRRRLGLRFGLRLRVEVSYRLARASLRTRHDIVVTVKTDWNRMFLYGCGHVVPHTIRQHQVVAEELGEGLLQ